MFAIPMGGFNPSFHPKLHEMEFYIGMGDTAEILVPSPFRGPVVALLTIDVDVVEFAAVDQTPAVGHDGALLPFDGEDQAL